MPSEKFPPQKKPVDPAAMEAALKLSEADVRRHSDIGAFRKDTEEDFDNVARIAAEKRAKESGNN